MKNVYNSPELEMILQSAEDIITTSPGTESPWGDLGNGNW